MGEGREGGQEGYASMLSCINFDSVLNSRACHTNYSQLVEINVLRNKKEILKSLLARLAKNLAFKKTASRQLEILERFFIVSFKY